MSLTCSPSLLFITCAYHLNLASFISSTPHLLISLIRFSFMSSYHICILPALFSCLFCNIYHSTSSITYTYNIRAKIFMFLAFTIRWCERRQIHSDCRKILAVNHGEFTANTKPQAIRNVNKSEARIKRG